MGDHEMKILNFADDAIVFLRNINCFTKIQSILKLYEKASTSKINFSNIQTLWAGAYKNRIDTPGQMIWSHVFIEMFGVHFANSVLYKNKWNKIKNKLLDKKIVFETECQTNSLPKEKKITVSKILFIKLWYKSQIYTIPKYIIQET